ncbi:MAG: glycogen/starch synthase [Deltaproteobacteria bacterium]|jgi:starch synthase
MNPLRLGRRNATRLEGGTDETPRTQTGRRGPHLAVTDAWTRAGGPQIVRSLQKNVGEAAGAAAVLAQAQFKQSTHVEIPKSGPVTDQLLAFHQTRPPASVRKQLDRLASTELHRLFDHPVRDAAIREHAELDLRTVHGASDAEVAAASGRPEIALREEQNQRRNALIVALSRPRISDGFVKAAIEKLGEVGLVDDVALIAKAARRRGPEVAEAAKVAKTKIEKAGRMTIVLAAFESKPYVNGGGLGNVMKELPPALARQGHKVVVVMPRHSVIDRSQLEETGEVGTVYGPKTEQFGLFKDHREGVDYYFVENDRYYSSGRDGVYRDSYGDYGDPFERYDFFGRALPVAIRHILGDEAPDVVQLNDAHTASGAMYLKRDPAFKDTATVMAIHNLGWAYQGRYEGAKAESSPIGDLGMYYPTGPAEAYGQVNLMKLGLAESDGAITVSRQYMQETLTEAGGEGLHGVLQNMRANDKFWGNLNGIDNAAWNPETDPQIAANFSFEDQSGKAACKASLQQQYGLPERSDVPLFGVVARMSGQKGIDDIIGTARRALEAGKDLQLVVCGEGEEAIRDQMKQLAADFPKNVAYDGKFAPEKEHTILSGSDFFLMPSRFEPCGLPQMYALRYLTVPVVRGVGGLEESISNFDANTGEGNGFKFTDDLFGTVERALDWYGQGEEARQPLLANCAASDFSWDNASALEQIAFYRKIINER